MAAGNTYTQIASTTLGSAAATVTFSSIPSTYTDLVLICDTKASTGTPNNRMQVNSDTGTNYSQTVLAGNGTTATSARYSSNTFIYVDYYATNDTTNNKNTIIQFMNYANTSTYKTFLSRANNAAAGTDAIVGLWRSTSAINSITVYATANWVSGATFNLYGITAA
jgi:hypothetical protein